MVEIKRGDVFWVNLDPTIGSEIKKTRPCVIVSNDVANRFSPVITIVPVTTQKLSKVFPHEVLLDSVKNLKNSKAKVNQIRTIDRERIGAKVATLSRTIVNKINWALANHLDLLAGDQLRHPRVHFPGKPLESLDVENVFRSHIEYPVGVRIARAIHR